MRTFVLYLIVFLFPFLVKAQFPFKETFKNSSASGIVYGGFPSPAILTSGQTVKYGSSGNVTDPLGGGYLRLTSTEKNQTGFVYGNQSFPSGKGLKIAFEYFTYGGSNADGICFFLFDANSAFTIGAFGGSLGYAQNNLNGVVKPGVSGGYLGIGLDEYGAFGRANEGKQGGYPDVRSQSVTIRGAGNGSAATPGNYPFLTSVRTSTWNSTDAGNVNFNVSATGSYRFPICSNPGYRKVFIELKPKTVSGGISYDIVVKIAVGGSTPVIYKVINNYTGFNSVAPANLKFGLAASTASQTNYHEVRNLTIDSYYDASGAPTADNTNFTYVDNISTVSGSAPVSAPAENLSKIPIDPKRWFQLNNTTNGLEAFSDSITNVNINTGFGKLLPVYDAYYPVKDGEQIILSGIRFFDWEGTAKDSMILSVITDQGKKKNIAYFTGSKYNTWVGPYPDRVTSESNKFSLDTTIGNIKYIVLHITSSVLPVEMEWLGTYKAPPAATLAVKKSIKLKEMFGVNAYEWDFLAGGTTSPMAVNETKIKVMKSFAGIRHYMSWEKLELTESNYTFNPVHSGGWAYDIMYERCKAEGIEVLACLLTIPAWMQNTYPAGERDAENTPVRFGKNFSDPFSYIEQAKVGFQYAARYGSNANIDVALLHVNTNVRWTNDPANVVKKGLNLIKYIECDNERNKWWKGRKAYQTPFEYAANLSAFYDGHKNTMGPGVGIKNADPEMVVVMGGLASTSTEYVRGMVDWCKTNRGYKADGTVNLCWDVINYHSYPNDKESAQGETSTRGAAPEVTQMAQNANEFIQMAHEYANDMEVWVTETGYDINQGSKLKAIPIGNKSAMQTQADWVLRTSLQYARSGIKRVFFYKTYDYDSLNSVKFGSMGLLNKNGTRRPAADFIQQTKNLLGEYTYKETLGADPFVDKYELDGKLAYALVVPDEIGRTANYTLNLGKADSARIYTPQAGSDFMSVNTVATSKGLLALTVTETPIFVIPFADGSSTSNARISGFESQTGDVEKETFTGFTINVFPNPTSDFIDINARNNDSEKQVLRINVYDQTGQLYKMVISNSNETNITERISLVNSPYGMYVIEVTQGSHREVKRIMRTF